jgi:deazaflavin-dependent oxidoreductase (nitroreductase family)
MMAIQRKNALRYLLRAPVHLYHWHLGRVLGTRFLLLTHIGRRTGLRHQTVLEVLEYRKEGPEAVVMSGFARDADWLRNIEATPKEEIIIGSHHFPVSHRFLSEDEAIEVVRHYEQKNWLIAPIVRSVLSRLSAGVIGAPLTTVDDS